MDLRLYDIIPELRPYIKVICSMESKGPSDSLPSFRVLPDTCVELFVNYILPEQIITANNISSKQPRSFIISRMSHYMDVQNNGSSGFISVCFLPGAASCFFKIPMNEIADAVIDLHDLWKHTAGEMEEKIAGVRNNDERVLIIQQYLLEQLRKQEEKEKTIEYWLWQVNFYKGQLAVEELSRKVNISQRQLARKFNQSIGLSPKEFIRVSRFIHSLTYLRKYPAISLTEIAYESGYYDQAHFIHDYKEYAGCTPGELVTSRHILY